MNRQHHVQNDEISVSLHLIGITALITSQPDLHSLQAPGKGTKEKLSAAIAQRIPANAARRAIYDREFAASCVNPGRLTADKGGTVTSS